MPIGALSKAPRKRSSLSTISSRTFSFIRHETMFAMHIATMKPPWIAAHFHGLLWASLWS